MRGSYPTKCCEQAKGRLPLVPLAERMEIVGNIGYVDKVFAERVPDKLQVWEELRFNVFFKGDDWRGTPQGERLEQAFGAVGVEVVYFPYTVHTSSSSLRTALELISQSPRTGTPPAGSPEMSGLHIAMVGTRGVPARYGGFETAIEEIGQRLVRRGHKVTVYCRDMGDGNREAGPAPRDGPCPSRRRCANGPWRR